MNRLTTRQYIWHRVAFPLWHRVRPQFEELAQATKIFDQCIPFVVRSNFDEMQGNGVRKGWLEWAFDGPCLEVTRLKVQALLEERFGKDASHFRWEGSVAITTLDAALAVGEYIQEQA